jgi:murein L,D-transpeptidase YafK
MVHGSCLSIGCYAMTNEKIEQIFALADAAFRSGQPFFRVHVFPFRPTDERLGRAGSSEWLEFWRNLKQGHDHFESTGRPPDVGVRGGRYVFRDDR